MEGITYRALVVNEDAGSNFSRSIQELNTSDLPDLGTLIRVRYSSLNYKDALSATGNRGITRRYPHTPGIDASGEIVFCRSGKFRPGDQVLVTGYDLGMNTLGGFGEYINVPDDWIVPLPSGLDPIEAMILGTAGFTAALAMHHLLRCGQKPEQGPVLVTGASGGVGSLAVHLLSIAGFEVIAASGKTEQKAYLEKLGASTVLHRDETNDRSGKALLKPRWAGAIDTVGGNILATVLKACDVHGNVASCGNALSPVLNTTVFPFILNGVNLLGVNSATTPMELRAELWKLLSTRWKPSILQTIKTITSLGGLEAHIQDILQGNITGRVVLQHNHA